ncbi:MAG: baseplate J/gp47 family protein [Minicystis sp.]
MAIALSDLVKNLDRKDVLEDFVNVAKALGLSTTGWQSGEPIYDVLTIFADQITNLWNNIIVQAIRAVFLDYATGDWLTLFAGTFYETWRNEATFATGSLVIENRSAGFYNFSAGDIKIKNSAGKTFTNQNAVTLAPYGGAGPYPTATIILQADEAGTRSNTPIGDIAGYPTTPASAPAGVYARPNTEAFLGSDEESDEALRARARLFAATFSPASPKSAYEAVALSVHAGPTGPLLPGDTGYSAAPPVNINRVKVIDAGNGTVGVLLASPAGLAAGDPVTPGTDVYIASAAIQDRVVPAGITAVALSATEHLISYGTITVYVDRASLVTAAEAQADVTNALNDFFSKLPIGGMKKTPGGSGYVWADEVRAKASEANKGIFAVDLLVGDVLLASYEVAVPSFAVNAVLVTQ